MWFLPLLTDELIINGGPPKTIEVRASSAVTIQVSKKLDLSNWTRVRFDVENLGDQPVRLIGKILGAGATDWSNSVIQDGFLRPHRRKSFQVILERARSDRNDYPALKEFRGMHGLPGGLQSHWHSIDSRNIESISLVVEGLSSPARVVLHRVSASDPVVPTLLSQPNFFPFVDEFGQYVHADFSRKARSVTDLRIQRDEEEKDLAMHTGPTGWDMYGGYAAGPKLTATGGFRTEKSAGRWWIVDPLGHVFWSHGACSTGYDSLQTSVKGREGYFTGLEKMRQDFPTAWSKDGNAVNHGIANWQRVFGKDWYSKVTDLTHRRLRSWGMNSFGNWSDMEMAKQDKTPYTVAIHPSAKSIAPKVWDVFDERFESDIDRTISSKVKATANDAWCIGYFVDNEMGFFAGASQLVKIVLKAPKSATGRAYISALQTAFPTISAFNAKFGTNLKDFDSVPAHANEIATARAEVTEKFYESYCERYFAAVKTSLARHAPKRLYLGCRFHQSNPTIIRVAAKYCDILSFNLYTMSVASFRPTGVDKPVIVSEWHFGSLDHGMLGTGLQVASDDEDRADKYAAYVQGALRNPNIVGSHWFAYCPEPISGRGDGENYDTGLFSVTNDPYPELRKAIRRVGYSQYQYRLAASSDAPRR